ncbi:3-phosphoglycerate dehydrogenase [Oenococcus sp. UCMA 17063]|nr:3-phosphoglycerate dehydrogenase [Oenococcus sp. UCMA 17063]
MTKILLTPRGFYNYGKNEINKLKKAGIEVIANDTGEKYDDNKFKELAKNADGIIVGLDKIDQSLISQSTKLKAIVKFGVGLDNIDVEYAKKKKILIGKTIGSNTISVAEMVFGLILNSYRNISNSISLVENNKWQKITGRELNSKTIGIIGYGNIGKQVERIAHGFGMKVMVLAHDGHISTTTSENGANTTYFVSKEKLLVNSDIVTLHLPLTQETNNFIGTNELKKMKKDSILINTSRGKIVNEKDLLSALKNKKIYAAAMDVYSSEPPFWEEKIIQDLLATPNFYLTPHIASRTVEAEKKTIKISLMELLNLLKINSIHF